MRRFCQLLWVCAMGWALGGVSAARADDDAARLEQGWHTLRHLPVLASGRLMPLDTFARQEVEKICGTQMSGTGAYKLAFDEKASGLAANSPELAEIRKLFPDDKPRKFEPIELLLSWLAEPERWEHVPFLRAEHEELRKLLDVPITGADGGHLKFVSPAAVMESDAFIQHFDGLQAKRREAMGQQPELSVLDEKVLALGEALQRFRVLAFSDALDPKARGNLSRQLDRLGESLATLMPELRIFSGLDDQQGIGQRVTELSAAAQQLATLSEQPQVPRRALDETLARLETSAAALADEFQRFGDKLKTPPADWSAEQATRARELVASVAAGSRKLVEQVRALHLAVYDNQELLRVAPALNPAALEVDRSAEDPPQPWIDLETLVAGGPELYPPPLGYPKADIERVRQAFQQLCEAYTDRAWPERGRKLELFASELESALAKLAATIEPMRAALPMSKSDPQEIAHTRYPAAGSTQIEVRYNRTNPFLWSWVIYLVALCCFCLSFGVLRRPLFWLGIAVMAGGVAWTVYGFALRVAITQFAPVTNMYETVIYVPFVVSVLGLWFALLPLTWAGIRNGWRLTAVPFTPEAEALLPEQARLMSPGGWNLGGWLLLVPRLAIAAVLFLILTQWNYAAGGRNVINLLPQLEGGLWSSTGDLQSVLHDVMVWLVGISVLAVTCWFVPRATLAILLLPVIGPWSRRAAGVAAMPHVYERWPFLVGGSFVAFFGACVAWYNPIPGKDVSALQPVLRDNMWLTIHVLTIVSSYAAGALTWILGNIQLGYYLFGKYREPMPLAELPTGHRPQGFDPNEQDLPPRPMRRLPPEECNTLAGYVYRSMQVAVLLLVAGTILGGLWADVSWGRFWGWDPKEVWALISALVYLAILHGRYDGSFGNFGLAVGSILGGCAIVFSWYGVNFVLGAGLHSYGFGQGGQVEVAIAVAINLVFLGAATARYLAETRLPAEVRPSAPADLRSGAAEGSAN